MYGQRATMVTEIINVLRSFFRNDSASKSQLQTMIQKCVTIDRIQSGMDLCRVIEDMLLQSWNTLEATQSTTSFILDRNDKALWCVDIHCI
jgi:hypothetical protein